MVKENVQPGEASVRPQAAFLILLSTALFCAGCANPGPPKPPSLDLPQPVKDLSAERAGDRVELRWTTPSRTTDDLEVKGSMTAEVCRETDPSSSTPRARRAVCTPVQRISVVPGPSEVADTLPPSLLAEPVRLIAYRIQIFNAAGRSAGDSTTAAYAAAGQAPPDVERLQAMAAEQGAILEWQSIGSPGSNATDVIDLKRLDLTMPPAERKTKPSTSASPGKNKPVQAKHADAQPKHTDAEAPNEAHLRAVDAITGAKANTAGTVDTTAQMGNTYTYSAQRVRAVTIGSHELEMKSSRSNAVTLAMRDTFPPNPPSGLETISGTAAASTAAAYAGPYVDLSWEPNSEPDLAGYRVYRQLARPDGSAQGPLARLTALPIAVPAYRDVAVRAGQGYIYSVTAVDAAGNESAPSAKALEVVSEAASPGSGEPPH